MRTLIILTILILISFASCRNEIPLKTAAALTSVKVAHINSELISIPVHSSGILLSTEEMRLSFKTGGIVLKIMVNEGDKVKKGDILATLNLSEINAQVNLAKSGYDKAFRDYNRAKNLHADSVATLEQMQNAATALSVAESNMEIARFNQVHSKIIAPDDGLILKQFVKTNELIAPGYPVFLFGTSGKNWRLKTGLSDRDIVKINPGDSAIVTIDAWPGVKFPAEVDIVGGMSNPLTGIYDVELLVNDRGYRFAAGFVTTADIFPSDKKTYLLIPVESLVEANGQSGYVFVVNDSSEVNKVKVSIITIIGTKAAITSEGSKIRNVVSGGAAYLHDGEKVRIVK